MVTPHPEEPNYREFLDALSESSREAFAAACTERSLPANRLLFAQGEPHTDTFLVMDGLVRTYYLSPLGKEITLAFWPCGGLIGGPDFFGPTPHIWSARTVKPTTVWSLPGESLRALTRDDTGIAGAVMEVLGFKTHWISVLLQTFTTECVTDRLAHHLVRLGEMHGVEQENGLAIEHAFTQQDLASMVGATRQWVSMTLNQLQRAGLISLEGRTVIINDLEALRSFGRP